MACFNCDIVACIRCVYEESRFITCAYWNMRSLERELNNLEDMRRLVNTRMEEQKRTQPGTRCRGVVRNWLDRVENNKRDVNVLLRSLRRRSGCTCCFAACNGITLLEYIRVVGELVQEGGRYLNDNELVEPIPIDPTGNINRDLQRRMGQLKDARKNVTTIIRQQERKNPGTECKVVVRIWLDDVDRKDKEVNDILHSVVETSSRAERVADLIDSIQSLVEDGRRYLDGEMVLVQPIPMNPIDNVPNLSTTMVGRDSKLSVITDSLKGDSQLQTIGIWGTGGIGKTTLLKSIKYELSKNHGFFYIVWIEIPSQNVVDIVDIQKKIASCIFLSFQPEKDEPERAKILSNALRQKKTLVLIDNVWNKLDFEKIGIPFGVHIDNVKIVFTTRSEGVCADMTAQKIVKLDYLDAANSLKLFRNNIRSDVNATDQIRERIDQILEKCGGLPLVILTVARTVAGYTRVEQWDDAVECLRNIHEKIEGMDEVMKCLKFSYDKLEDDEIESCLLYFSLYPEGASICIDELIKEWKGEGFLESYAKGHAFIHKLKSLCLVESGFYYDTVKVHNEIRDMLGWISKNVKGEVVLVYNKDQDDVSNYNDWDSAKRICLNERQLKCLTHENGMPSCPNLTTLIVEANYPHRNFKLPTKGFFHLTPSLRVLDLSYTRLVKLPRSIGKLGELRYLNLFHTRVAKLPKELGNLKNLMCLDLGKTLYLKRIAKDSISQLSMLQSLNLVNTKYRWDSDIDVPQLKLEDLSELKNLEDLGVDFRSNSQLNTFFGNEKISNSITSIRFVKIAFTKKDLQPIKLISERFPRLKLLMVVGCVLPGNVLEMKHDQGLVVENLSLWKLKISSVMIVKDGCRRFGSLKILEIYKCECLKEVSWTTHLTSLQELFIRECNGIDELVATGAGETEEERKRYFPELRILMILGLKNLQRIHERSRPLLFPALERLVIRKCPKLKQLSLGLDSANKIQIIRCEQEKWDSLEWEDDQVKDKFLPYFCASIF